MINSLNTNLDVISQRADIHKSQTSKDRLSDFITILTTQLKNQDPTSPMETKDFSQLLGVLVSVEQNSKTNDFLQEIVNLQKDYIGKNNKNINLLNSSVVSYIGHNVTASCNMANLTEGGAHFIFNLEKSANNVFASVYDKNNHLISVQDLGRKTSGLNKFLWSGEEGNIGDNYRLEINAYDNLGQPVRIDYNVIGSVKSVEISEDDQLYLKLDNDVYVTLSQISSVFANN